MLYYLLFRIYKFYTDRMKEKEIPLFYTSCVSTILIYFNLMTIYVLLVYWDLVAEIITGKYYSLIPMAIIWLFNYFLFVRSEIFLKYNFRKDVKGGILIGFYIFITAASSIAVANYNREKILRDKPKSLTSIRQLKY